jgi:hypothetical protein
MTEPSNDTAVQTVGLGQQYGRRQALQAVEAGILFGLATMLVVAAGWWVTRRIS